MTHLQFSLKTTHVIKSVGNYYSVVFTDKLATITTCEKSACLKKAASRGGSPLSLPALSTQRPVYFPTALIVTLIGLFCVGSSLVIENESFVVPFLVGANTIVTV